MKTITTIKIIDDTFNAYGHAKIQLPSGEAVVTTNVFRTGTDELLIKQAIIECLLQLDFTNEEINDKL